MRTIIYSSIIILFSLLSSCGSNEGIDMNMIPIRHGNKTLYLNSKGKTVLELDSIRSGLFSDGMALAYGQNNKAGFIDTKGKFIISPQYKDALAFSDDVAWVVKENGFPELIDKDGDVRFALEQASIVNSFHEGVAVFESVDQEGKTLYGCVDKSGNIKIKPQEKSIDKYFSEGKIVVRDEHYKEGYMNKSGDIVINCQFDDAMPFKKDLACVKLGDKWGVIDSKGTYIVNPRFDRIMPDGDWFLFVENGKYGWCDKDGKYIINPQFATAFPFYENDLAPVSNDKAEWGYIDRKGILRNGTQFQIATPFIKNEVAVVMFNKLAGVIDKNEKYIVNPQYENIDTKFVEYLVTREIPYEKLYSDYFDIAGIINKIKNMIQADSILGLPYSYNVGQIIPQYSLSQSDFSKTNSSTKLLSGKLGTNAEYKFFISATPWVLNSQGWFSSYEFNPEALPNSYSFVIELDWKQKNKAEQLMNEIYKAFSNGIGIKDIRPMQYYGFPHEDYDMAISYNDAKVTIAITPPRI